MNGAIGNDELVSVFKTVKIKGITTDEYLVMESVVFSSIEDAVADDEVLISAMRLVHYAVGKFLNKYGNALNSTPWQDIDLEKLKARLKDVHSEEE